jgi:pentatricopeptide repeat protein
VPWPGCSTYALYGLHRWELSAVQPYRATGSLHPGGGRAPNVITYNALIRACGKSGRWELSRKMFMEMRAAGVAPNTYIFDSLITSYSVEWWVGASASV